MADPEDDGLSPRDELLRILGTQDNAAAFPEALAFLDDIITTLMMEFARRYPAEFREWCLENEIDEDAVQSLIQREEQTYED